MKIAVVLIAASVFAIPTTATAQVDEHGCPDGTTYTETAGLPLCLAPIWLDGTWHDDPHTCLWGWYQGSCAPEPAAPVVLEVEAYLYQIDEPTPAQITEVVAKRIVWLTPAELRDADRRYGPR